MTDDATVVETFHFGPADFPDGPAGPWGSNGPDVPTYILANGDTTGYGLHADFANVSASSIDRKPWTDVSYRAGTPPFYLEWSRTVL